MAKKVFVLITEDPYNSEASFGGLRYAMNVAMKDNDTTVFLLGAAAVCARKGQEPTGVNMGEWVKDVMEAGAKVYVCGMCFKARGHGPEDVIEGVTWGTMGNLVELSTGADVQLSF